MEMNVRENRKKGEKIAREIVTEGERGRVRELKR